MSSALHEKKKATMQDRYCDCCGTVFHPQNGAQKRCSKPCWDKKNAEQKPLRMAGYRVKNRAAIREKNRVYAANNRERLKEKAKKYWHKIKDRPEIKASRAQYLTKYLAPYVRNRRARDPQFKMLTNLRRRLNHAVKGKSDKTKAYLGCTVEELRLWLESQFQPGMTWENYGYRGWHIDHKKPLSSFQFVNSEGKINESAIHASMHYTNLQPLWQWQNAAKSDTYISVN